MAAVAFGQVPGQQLFRRFGNNPSVGTSAEDIWEIGGERILPTVAAPINIVSTDAADTSAGTGARTVSILALDANFDMINLTVTLDGTTPVVIAGNCMRVIRMFVATAGTGNANAGVITASIGGDTQAVIGAGINQTEMAMLTVPRNFRGFLTNFSCTIADLANNENVSIDVEVRSANNNVWRPAAKINASGRTFSGITQELDITLEPMMELRVRGVISSNTTQVSVEYTVIGQEISS